MYTPDAFKTEDLNQIYEFVAANSFGMVISIGTAGRIEETHTPMFLSEDRSILYGHVARANGQWRSWGAASAVKSIFHGPHCYVSPTFYASDFNVPTWNYTAVSISGEISIITEREEQKQLMRTLVAKYEGDGAEAWRLDEEDERLMQLFGAIVFFSIRVENVEAKFKLNQNKAAEDRQAVGEALLARGGTFDREISEMMATTNEI